MRWIRNTKPKDVLNIGDGPQDDVTAARKIRDICSFASDSAERLAVYTDGRNDKYKSYQRTRYEGAKKRALETALNIQDGLLRDASLRHVIKLCLRANDVRTATVLVTAIQSVAVKVAVLKDHPTLNARLR